MPGYVKTSLVVALLLSGVACLAHAGAFALGEAAYWGIAGVTVLGVARALIGRKALAGIWAEGVFWIASHDAPGEKR